MAAFTHSPFPDVTGLRTSGPDWSRIDEDNEFIEASLETQLSPEQLQVASSGAADLIWAAFSAILYHYGSHEYSNVEILDLSLPRDEASAVVAMDFEAARTQQDFDVPHLLAYVGERRRDAIWTDKLDHGFAAVLLPADGHLQGSPPSSFDELRLRSSNELSLVLTASVRTYGSEERLVLSMKASSSVHTQDSAKLQLQQVASLLSSFGADRSSPALSLERFDLSLRASDNIDYVELPAPEYLQDRNHDQLESEFEYFADARPHDIALDFRFDLQDRRAVKWTYAEMNAKADKVRDLLWSHGVGSASSDDGDHIVALYLEKSPETYLSFLSVVKAGAAWCPIDTDWPASRRQALLAKSNAKVVLVAGDAVSRNLQEDLQSEDLAGRTMHPIRLDHLDDASQANGIVPTPVRARSRDQLAYMIWTSGTTGLPKGVGIQHWAIIQAMRALRQKIPYGKAAVGTDEVRYLQYSAYNFDLSIMDCFYAWGIGGTICACPRGLLLQDLVAVGTSFQPTHTLLTPAVMAMTERHAIPSLKVVINGGEKLSQVVADEWSKECCLLNLYGPAEATLIAMNRRVPLGDRVKAPNIGVALPTVSCHALDKADSIVLKGAVGELVLGGPQLARGYVGDPVKTADKFFPHLRLGRVYRTGDLVRQLGNAEFEYLGRIDDQVKINGIRIELLEINAAIKNSHAKVKDSETMAFPRPGSEAELQIVNFSVFPHEDGDGEQLLRTDAAAVAVAKDLQRAARESLPSYMLPSMFVILSRFPRTSSAKIDRVALKQVLADFDSLDWENKLAAGEAGEDEVEAPSQAEECMRKWLAKLCNVAPERIGRNTPFTSVGLDSIRAITFSQRLLQEGYTVSVVDVAEHPTLISLSKHLDSSATQAQEKEAQAVDFFARFDRHFRAAALDKLAVSDSDVRAVLPCTPLQEGMLVESQQDPMAYRILRQYRISGHFDVQKLQSALQNLIDEVDILRTTFVEVGSLALEAGGDWPLSPIFLQLIWSSSNLRILEVDVPAGEAVEDVVLQVAENEVQLDPFSKQPPLAFLVVHSGPDVFLVLVAHHSIYDARSLSILEDRVERLYAGDPSLPRIYQFPTALSHILPLTEDDEEQRRGAWAEALAAYPRGELSLFPNLSGVTARGVEGQDSVHRSLYKSASVGWNEVERVSRKLGISARPLVQTAWAKVLAAYLETDHLIIGDSVSGRSAAAELEQVVGPVLSTLPVAVYLDHERTVADTAREVDAFHRSVFTAQHTHLGSIRKLLELPAGQQLFHSVFVFEPAAEASSASSHGESALRLTRVADLAVATEHALGVEVQPNADGSIRIGVSWQRAQVSDAYGQLLLEQFDACLAAMCASPDTKLADCLAPASARPGDPLYAVSRMDAPASIEAAHKINVALFVSAAAATEAYQDANAVEIFNEIPPSKEGRSPSVSITYAQLDAESSRFASLLEEHRLPRNSVVAVSVQRGLASYIYPLGVLKAGHTYLPLDETLPLDRKKLLMQDSGAVCIVTDSDDFDELAGSVQLAIHINAQSHKDELGAATSSPALPAVEPDATAFIIYTSGSTGKPKGCQLTYSNLSTAIEAFRLVYEREAPGSFEQGVRFLARSAEAFDVHLLEIFLSLRVGATIVTGPRNVVHDDIAQTMSALEITHACVVPSLFFSKGERVRPEQVPSLRALIIGGEAITSDLCEIWGSEGDERPVVLNAYGPSEATIGNSIARVSKRSATGNIGKPFSGTGYLVLKSHGNNLTPALRGEPGELCIAGPQVAQGYLGRPDLQSFLDWNGTWLYRTGDLVRLNAADEAEYLGRIDGSQVKVRGARLELGEVDDALQRTIEGTLGHRGVAVTVLVDHPKLAGPPRLVSFVSNAARRVTDAEIDDKQLVQLDAESKVKNQELRRAVRSKLPQYMVPSQIVFLRYLPLSLLSGKANQKALKALYQGLDPESLEVASAEEGREANDDEKAVAKLVASTLRLDSNVTMTPATDLIALGLDSLSVVTLASRLRKAGFDVNAATILSDPTLEAIAVAGRRGHGHGLANAFASDVQRLTELAKSLPAMKDREAVKALPCVPLQTALVAQASSGSSTAPQYVTTITVDVTKSTSAEVLKKAWTSVLQRHEIYNTVFDDIEGQLCQIVLAPTSCPDVWATSHGSALTSATLQEHHRAAARDIVTSFAQRPPLRLRLWEAEKDVLKLTLTMSHAIYDGTSLNQLLREVNSALRGHSKQPGSQFSDAASEILGQSEDAAKRFWLDHLHGYGRTAVPRLTGMKGSAETANGAEITVTSTHKFSDLEAAARSRGVTIHSLLVSAYSRLLAEYVGEDEVTIGLVLGGRTLSVDDIDLIHGPCVTTVPFRVQNTRCCQSDDFVRSVNRNINGVLPFQHVSLPQLMRWIGMDKVPFEALFSYLGPQTARSSQSALIETGTIMEKDYPLAVEVGAVGEEVSLHLSFSPDTMPETQAGLFLKQLDSSLTRLLSSGPPPLDNDELLSTLNRDCYNPSADSETFLSRFARQVEAEPEAVAVVYAKTLETEMVTLTYRQLDSMSSNMARHLLSQSSEVIGVHLTKDGPELYAAMLAVWKAGKIYLPLDPSLPQDRLAYMLETVGKAPAIANAATASTLAGSESEVLLIDDLVKDVREPVALPKPTLDAACYLLFTSGSTGRPKAVQIGQRGLSGAIYSWERMLPWSKQSRFLQLASIGFDVSLIEVCMPLALGFSIGTAPKEVLIEDLTAAINKLGITIADLPAALAGTVHPDDVKLEWLMSGGDAIDERVINDWTTADRILINAWGPTETTIGSSLGQVKRGGSRSNVGQVYPACSMFVLKEDSTELVFRGAVGELAVGGPQVADKYYGRDDLTAEKFIHMADGTRVYRTGDLGRFLSNGDIECLGRIGADRQVKVNGQRVELDEISQALANNAEVRDADVQYLKHPSMSSKQLVAFVAPQRATLAPSSTLEVRDDAEAVELVSELEQEATKRLAPYMIPAQWLVVNGNLPLTPNNKIDHKALAALFNATSTSALAHFGSLKDGALAQGAWTPVEEELRDVLADFCHVPAANVTKTTSFHRLGIDSITAIKLVKKLRLLGYKVSVADILSSPFVGSLAEKHESAGSENSTTRKGSASEFRKHIESRAATADWKLGDADALVSVLPCTPLQAGMITQTLASGGKLYYHHHGRLVQAAPDRVAAAWKTLSSRSDILRTTFHSIEDERPWVQVVHATTFPRITEHHGSFDPAVDLASVDGQPNFDSDDDFATPPHALHLWRQGADTVMVLSIHHALYDAASLPLLLSDFARLVSGSAAALPDRANFSELVPHLLPADADTEHWTDELKGISPTLVRSQKTAKKVDARAVEAEHAVRLPIKTIQQSCQSNGVSMQVLATLAYAKLLALETNSGDVCFGQIFGLRDGVEDGEPSVGPALNTVATRVRFDSCSRSMADQLQAMQRANDAGRPHRKAALRDVQQALVREGVQGPLFDALFDFQIVEVDGAENPAPGLFSLLDDLGDESSPQYTLNVEFVQGTEELTLVSTADSTIYSKEDLAATLERLEKILIDIVEHPDAPLEQLPFGDAIFPSAASTSPRDPTRADSPRHAAQNRLPETVDGKKLADVIAQVAGLPVEQIYSSTRLSSLGLDSISAIRIASLARRQGLTLGVADIVSAETVEGIIDLVASKKQSPSGGARPTQEALVSAGVVSAATQQLSIKKDSIERILPLLSGQAVLAAGWIETGKKFGVYSFALGAPGRLDASRLNKAWAQLQKRHAILRTCFVLVDGKPYQVVLKPGMATSATRETTTHSGSLEDSARETIRAANAATWDLRSPPVQLEHISSESEKGSVLVLSMHHLLYDAFALDLLLDDLEALYHGAECTSSPNWVEFVDHLATAASNDVRAAMSFWKQALHHADNSVLKPSQEHDNTKQAAVETFTFKPNVLTGLRQYEARLRANQTSVQAVFIAAWSRLLSTRTGSSSPTFGIFQLGRSAPFDGIERLAGPCMSILPIALSASTSNGTLLEAAKDAAHQLRLRSQFEQTDLLDIFDAAGWDKTKPMWNSYLNVLLPSDSAPANPKDGGEAWHSLKLGNPTDFVAPSTGSEGAYRSTLDDIPHVPLVRTDVNVDVALDPAGETVSVAIRASGAIMNEHEADDAVAQLVHSVKEALDSLL